MGPESRPLRALLATTTGLVVVTFLQTLFLLPPAVAGGALVTWDKGAYAPGQTVRGSVRFGKGCCNRGVPSDGPFFVYLYEPAEGQEIPPLPRGAVRVGVIEVSGEASPWTATYSFTMPFLHPGEYAVIHCNDPCTKMLGDIVEPSLIVANDPEVRLWAKMRWLERRVFGSASRLESAINRLSRDSSRGSLRLDALEERVRLLEVASSASGDVNGTEESSTPVRAGVVGAATLALLGAIHLLTRRRNDQSRM